MKKHTEDCLDANDDTSVLKGQCICPKSVSHTPTPWFISENTLDDVSTQKTIWIDDMSGNAVFALPKMGGRTYESQMIDAAYIVKCVNAHEALLAVAKYAVAHANGETGEHESGQDTELALFEMAKQAIAKTEGL